jgi:membrane fusion protein, multidrug efflux system
VNEAMAQGTVGVAAISQDNKTVLDQGTLLLVDNQIDQTTGTIKLKATFPNLENKLWPGQFINARLLLDIKKQALTIPSTAAQRGPEGMFVYVVKSDQTVEVRPVKTGGENGKDLLIESGLQEGEQVVTSNQYRLQPGIAVKKDMDEAKPTSSTDETKTTTPTDAAKPASSTDDTKTTPTADVTKSTPTTDETKPTSSATGNAQ